MANTLQRMGKRRRMAALGATFALLVAACASSPREDLAQPERERASTTSAAPTVDVGQPTTLADTSFVLPAARASSCRAGHRSAVSLFDDDGNEQWSFAIPRPTGLTTLHETTLVLGFGWDRGLQPGIGAFDLEAQTPLWQRFLDQEPDDFVIVDQSIVMAIGDEVRAISLVDGADLWIARTEFGLRQIRLTPDAAYAIDPIAVHAIDTRTGEFLWHQSIDRPDRLEVEGNLLVVAANTRVLGIDVNARALLWDREVARIGAGRISIGGTVVLLDLSPDVAPAGGVVALAQTTGVERWKLRNVDLIEWTSADRFVASSAAADFRGGQAYDLVGIDAETGTVAWSHPMTAPLRSALLGSSENQLLVQDPHPAIGATRVRLINTSDGTTVWELATHVRYDGASFDGTATGYVYRVQRTFDGPRGELNIVDGPQRTQTLRTADGITQPPIRTPAGLVVISGEESAICAGRQLVSLAST